MMEHYAKREGSNEFFARRAAYNAARKLSTGDNFRAIKYIAQAEICIRSGGVTAQTQGRIEELKKVFEPCTKSNRAFQV